MARLPLDAGGSDLMKGISYHRFSQCSNQAFRRAYNGDTNICQRETEALDLALQLRERRVIRSKQSNFVCERTRK